MTPWVEAKINARRTRKAGAVGAITLPGSKAKDPKPLRPTPNVITATNLNEYVDLIEPLIDSLNEDVHSYIPTGDSAKLLAEAAAYDLVAEKLEGVGEFSGEYRARAEAKRKLAKAATPPADQLERNLAFVAEWDAFYKRWTHNAEVMRAKMKEIPFALTTGADWTTMQGYDLEYQRLSTRYEAMGFPLTMRIPPNAPDIPNLIPWWLPYLAGAAIVTVALVYAGPIIIRLLPAAKAAKAAA